MRQLKKSERQLMAVFGALIFLMATLFVFQWAKGKQIQAKARLSQLKTEKSESEFWLGQKAIWNERKVWLDQTQPRLQGQNQESAQLLDLIKEGAKTHKITITNQNIEEPSSTPDYQAVSIHLDAKGSLEGITRWLAGLQKPDNFIAVTTLNLKKDAETANIICSVTFARWYAVQ